MVTGGCVGGVPRAGLECYVCYQDALISFLRR